MGSIPGDTSGKEPSCPCIRRKRPGFNPWVGKIPGGGPGNLLHYSCLENPWMEEPGGLQSMGSQRVKHDWSDWAHTQVGERCSLSWSRWWFHGCLHMKNSFICTCKINALHKYTALHYVSIKGILKNKKNSWHLEEYLPTCIGTLGRPRSGGFPLIQGSNSERGGSEGVHPKRQHLRKDWALPTLPSDSKGLWWLRPRITWARESDCLGWNPSSIIYIS